MTLQPHLKCDNGQPVVDISKRIIMPFDGFVQSLSVQENIVKQLIEAGVLKQNPPEAAGAVSLTEKRVDKKSEQQG
jgi:hypothetical protein